MRQLALAAVALLLLANAGCKRKNSEVGGVRDTTTLEVETPPEPTTPAAPTDYSFDQRQQFVESIKQQLAGIDAEIDQLASQAKSKGGAVSDRALARVRDARQAVNRNLQKAQAATADSWDKARGNVTRSLDNLEETIGAAQPK
jgi:hypothetical protein